MSVPVKILQSPVRLVAPQGPECDKVHPDTAQQALFALIKRSALVYNGLLGTFLRALIPRIDKFRRLLRL